MNFIQRTWHYGAGTALCGFGVIDCVGAYRGENLNTTLKVAYYARGLFFATAGVLSLFHVPSRVTFAAAHLVGVGLNGYQLFTSGDLESKLGLISSIAYIAFSIHPHPATFSIAFLSGSINVLLKLRTFL